MGEGEGRVPKTNHFMKISTNNKKKKTKNRFVSVLMNLFLINNYAKSFLISDKRNAVNLTSESLFSEYEGERERL